MCFSCTLRSSRAHLHHVVLFDGSGANSRQNHVGREDVERDDGENTPNENGPAVVTSSWDGSADENPQGTSDQQQMHAPARRCYSSSPSRSGGRSRKVVRWQPNCSVTSSSLAHDVSCDVAGNVKRGLQVNDGLSAAVAE